MTQRERHASAGLSATVEAPVAMTPTAARLSARASLAEDIPGREAWEDLYRCASPAQQQELLTLAGKQGLLYAHQLPAPNTSSRVVSDDSRGTRLLSQALHGHLEDLPAVTVEPVAVSDTALDALQRDAVARMLSTPDLGLLQGLPGTGKSRVVAEIITQAAQRGERILLLASAPAALDRVLELVHGREVLCPIRCLGREERPAQLCPAARAATLEERIRGLREDSLGNARQKHQQAEARCQQRRQEENLWARLQALAEEFQELVIQGDKLAESRRRIPEEVSRLAETNGTNGETLPFQVQMNELTRTHRETLARVDAQLTDLAKEQTQKRQKLDTVLEELNSLKPLAEAKQHVRWWSGLWWKATFQGDVPKRVTELEEQQQTLQAALAKLEQDRQSLTQQHTDEEQRYQQAQTAVLEAECARRQGELDLQRCHLDRHQSQLRQHWQTLSTGVESERLPAEMTLAAVQAAQAQWQKQAQQEEEACQFARQWATHLEESLDTLIGRLPQFANLVAATTVSLSASPEFGDPNTAAGQFDLLVLEEAEQFTESEFLKAARRARRWILVGEPTQAAPGRHTSHGLPRSAVFHRLWQHFHCNPSRLPYTWQREQGGLCCRLRPVAAEQRQWLERESLADFPEIELRILAQPRTPPALAEVLFPPSLSMPQAKEFIYRELQELAVQAHASSLRWRDDATCFTVSLSEHVAPDGPPVFLEEGVREVLGRTEDRGEPSAPAWTCQLEFDREAGWTRQRAEEWLWRHLKVRDLQRTALLETPQRMNPALAAVLSDGVLITPYRLPAELPASPSPALEFVLVPPLRKEGGERRRKEGPRAVPSAAHLPRAGAGLELDLAAPRPGGDRLPADLRAHLPQRGLVNYFEAQTIVRKLEELFASPEPPDQVGVMALYPAQVELLRQLVQRIPKLASAALEIDGPAAFRQREFDVAILSLTRSHSHRAVPYGDGPGALLLALTRARHRLILVGDAGTLARRVQWQGALDHLDEAAAATEVRVLSTLLRYLQGQGGQPNSFQVSEGSGA